MGKFVDLKSADGFVFPAYVAQPAGKARGAVVLQDIQAAIDYAAQAGKVGVAGYCWGGLLTWRTACILNGVSAAVPSYYGGGVKRAALAFFARQLG